MQLHVDRLYHIYNRGNNRKLLFYEERNYQFFLAKLRSYILPHCDLLQYCLMPNHFHLQIHANEKTVAPWKRKHSYLDCLDTNPLDNMTMFSRGLQICLSSYARAMNNQYKRTGSLFTQNTHAKQTSSESLTDDYSLWCFNYIHNNPVLGGLVSSPENWKYSSYREYAGLVKDPLCNIELGTKLLRLDLHPLSSYGSLEIPDFILSKIF